MHCALCALLAFASTGLRCLVIIDLKLGKFTHVDAGQLHLYLNFAREHWTLPEENPPVGLILCAEEGPRRREVRTRRPSKQGAGRQIPHDSADGTATRRGHRDYQAKARRAPSHAGCGEEIAVFSFWFWIPWLPPPAVLLPTHNPAKRGAGLQRTNPQGSVIPRHTSWHTFIKSHLGAIAGAAFPHSG